MMDMLFRGNPELCCKKCGRYLGTWRMFRAGLWAKMLGHRMLYKVTCRYCKELNVIDRERGREYLGILGEQADEWKGKKP